MNPFEHREIILTQGKVTVVDSRDYGTLAQYNWYAHRATCGRWDVMRNAGPGRKVYMHRQILGMDDSDVRLVDHRNGDGLDNTRANLRFCTRQTNPMNRKINQNNSSGYKGVFWDKSSGNWRAKIQVSRRQINLGRFDKPEDAHAAYCE